MAKERIILGIDPGTTIMGFGIIKVINNKMIFLQLNELNLVKYKDHYLKLKLNHKFHVSILGKKVIRINLVFCFLLQKSNLIRKSP